MRSQAFGYLKYLFLISAISSRLENDLSTYSFAFEEHEFLFGECAWRYMVLMDELGAGTDRILEEELPTQSKFIIAKRKCGVCYDPLLQIEIVRVQSLRYSKWFDAISIPKNAAFISIGDRQTRKPLLRSDCKENRTTSSNIERAEQIIWQRVDRLETLMKTVAEESNSSKKPTRVFRERKKKW